MYVGVMLRQIATKTVIESRRPRFKTPRPTARESAACRCAPQCVANHMSRFPLPSMPLMRSITSAEHPADPPDRPHRHLDARRFRDRAGPPVWGCGRRRAASLLPDFPRRRSVYVAGVDPKGAQSAPFYYLYLRRNAAARGVGSLGGRRACRRRGAGAGFPVLARPLRLDPAEPALLRVRHRQCVGAGLLYPGDHGAHRQPVQSVSPDDRRGGGGDGRRPSPPRSIRLRRRWVKLRAESCRAPDLLVRSAERRTIYMTRGFEAWARSNGRAFRNGAAKSVRKYLTAMSGYALGEAQQRLPSRPLRAPCWRSRWSKPGRWRGFSAARFPRRRSRRP